MNVFVFDIETVPDVVTGARLLGLTNESPIVIAEAMQSLHKESTGQSFLKHHLHRVVAISAVLRHDDTLKVWSLGDEAATEAELIQRFFAGLEKYIPTLVSWNGAGFDLPVLHYRALLHGIAAPSYWDQGDFNSSFKYNNYLSRYHTRHIDLLDTLAGYQMKAFARLDDIAIMLGLPGKMGMSGSQVWDHFIAGKLGQIRDYCETDVLNTYLIFLRFQLMRGQLNAEQYDLEIQRTKNLLQQATATHLQDFLAAWQMK